MSKNDLLEMVGSIAIAEAAGIVGSITTQKSVDTWCHSLEKPSYTPPKHLFGPVWVTLYGLMGTAAYLVYEQGWEKTEVKRALNAYFTQLVMNSLWSVAFFGLKSPSLGLADIILMWGTIVLTINLFYKVSKTAAVLMLPYILWVTFAMVLNANILIKNLAKDKDRVLNPQ